MAEDKDLVPHRSEVAMARIRQLRLTATPEVYALWYAYLGQEKAELVRDMDALLTVDPVTQAHIEALYRKHIASPDPVTAIRGVVQAIQAVISQGMTEASQICENTTGFARTLTAALDTLDHANLPAAIDTISAEAVRVASANLELSAKLQASSLRVKDLQRRLNEAELLASRDALTGLANRMAFDAALRQAAQRGDGAYSVILLDVDHFKRFNDAHGHQLGDLVLQVVARVLSENAKGRDLVARYGGEEFAILLNDPGADGGRALAEQIRNALASKRLTNKRDGSALGSVTISAGLTRLRQREPMEETMERADRALYAAKRQGRNRVCLDGSEGLALDAKAA